MLFNCRFFVSEKPVFNRLLLKPAVLSLFLLTSLLAHADSEGSAAASIPVPADESSAQESRSLIEPSSVAAPLTEKTTGHNTAANPVPDFPPWHQQSNNKIIPPPPPGPYASSALSDFSVKQQTFRRELNSRPVKAPVTAFNPAMVPMEVYSPDRPWPDDIRGNKRYSRQWSPASRYPVKPVARYNYGHRKAPVHTARGLNNNRGFYAPGYSRPTMNWPAMDYQRPRSGQGWMPSMSMGRGDHSMAYPYPQNRRQSPPVPYSSVNR